MAKKFYWLKLQKDFFKRHDIRIIENMPNGKDYILFYLKLLLESVSHEGELRFSDTIPYDENMLSTITNTNIDVVRAAMQVFKSLEMIEVYDDKTIYMVEVEKMIGSETKWAEKKRDYRARVEDKVRTIEDNVRQEKEIEIDIEKDIYIDINKNKDISLVDFFDSVWKLYPRKEGKSAISKSKMKELYKVGYERLSKAVMKYADSVKGRDKQYILMGSTFFNTRYKDYLDDEEPVADDTTENDSRWEE